MDWAFTIRIGWRLRLDWELLTVQPRTGAGAQVEGERWVCGVTKVECIYS